MTTSRKRDILLAIVVLISTAAVASAVSLYGIPPAPCASTLPRDVEFTIVANLEGYNNSKSFNGQGPLISVQTCDLVLLRLENRDAQAHGLAVDFYAASGIEAPGGNTVNIRFLAYKTGSYRVFCNTICSVHTLMQHAQLSVTCTLSSGCN